LPCYLLLIKHLVNSQETLLEYQTKVEAMVEMVLAKDLIDYPTLKLHTYLWALSDVVGKAKSLSEDLMSALNRITTLLMHSGEPIFNR
jgi:hypothetical protein